MSLLSLDHFNVSLYYFYGLQYTCARMVITVIILPEWILNSLSLYSGYWTLILHYKFTPFCMCPFRTEGDLCISRSKACLTGTQENGVRWSLIHQLSIVSSLRQMRTCPALVPEKTLGLWGTALLIETATETQSVPQGCVLFSEGCDLINLLEPLQIALNVLV